MIQMDYIKSEEKNKALQTEYESYRDDAEVFLAVIDRGGWNFLKPSVGGVENRHHSSNREETLDSTIYMI